MLVTTLFLNDLVFDLQCSKKTKKLFLKCSFGGICEVLGESNYDPVPFTKN